MKNLSTAGVWVGLAALLTHCGATVTASDSHPDAAPAADVAADVALPGPTPGCAEVRATCTGPTAMLVRGHAEGLIGVDGARAEFVVRYRRVGGPGDASEVALGRSAVRGGSFETCVCVPYGANGYPSIGAVVFRPGASADASRDVARAVFSQRYATLGDEDLSASLTEAPSAPRVEAAIAAREPRSLSLEVTGLDPSLEGGQVYAGVLAEQRPVAAQVASATVTGRAATLRWEMPGRAYAGERLVLLVDRNHDRHCDASDLVASAPLGPAASVSASSLTIASASAAATLCTALSVDAPRE